MRCRDLMKTSPEWVSMRDDAKTAARKMRDSNVGFLPVLDPDGRVVGTVTDRDLTIRLISENMPASTSIGDVMSHEVVFCRPDDDLREAERRMAREHKSRMLVLDEAGKLLGVFSLSDVAHNEPADRTARTLREVTDREVRSP